MASVLLRRFLCRNLTKFKKETSLAATFKGNISCFSYINHSIIYDTKRKEKLCCIQAPRIQFLRDNSSDQKQDEKKLTLFQKFKSMYKDYWYVLIPVHVVTSIGWFGGFYYMAESGVDIVGILEYWNVNENIVSKLRDSSMGYFALAYGCYKIATPARYTVTLGGTTLSINFLKKWGYIKPVPSSERLKEMYQEKKDNIIVSMRETKEEIFSKTDKLKDKLDDKMRETKEEFKSKTDKLKDKLDDKIENFGKGLNSIESKIIDKKDSIKKKTIIEKPKKVNI